MSRFAHPLYRVLGSVVSIYASMLLGFRATMIVTVTAYALLTAWDVASEREPGSAAAGRIFLAAAALAVAALSLVLEWSTAQVSL